MISARADDLSSGVDYQFDDDCFAAKRQGLAKFKVDSNTANYNSRCDHEWALKQATSLNYVSVDYLEKRLEKSQAADIASLRGSGVCLNNEDHNECIDRLKRELLAMKVKVRNETLKFNKSRADMAVENGRTFQNGSENVAETKKNYTVLNDLYRASENQKKTKQLYRIFEPQPIDFSKDASVEELREGHLLKSNDAEVKSEDLKKVMGLKGDQKLEYGGSEENAALKEKLEKALSEKDARKNVYSSKNYEKDQKKKEADIKELMKSKKKKNVNVDNQSSISVMSFTEVMDDIQESALGINPQKKQSSGMRAPSGGGLSEPGESSIHAVPRVSNNSAEKKPPEVFYDYQIEKMLMENIDPLDR